MSDHHTEAIVRFRHEGGHTRGETARRFAISEKEVERVLWSAEPTVYPEIRLEPTPADVVAARDGELPGNRLIPGEHPQLRWDRIASRAGITVETARNLYDSAKGEGASSESYTGRGRRFDSMAGGRRSKARKRVPKQWVVDVEYHLRHAKKRCAHDRAKQLGGSVIELSGMDLERHRQDYGEAPSARCARKGCWGERERAQVKPRRPEL